MRSFVYLLFGSVRCINDSSRLELSRAASNDQLHSGKVPNGRTMERQIRTGNHVFAQRKPTERHVIAIPAMSGKEDDHAGCADDRQPEQQTLVARRAANVIRSG